MLECACVNWISSLELREGGVISPGINLLVYINMQCSRYRWAADQITFPQHSSRGSNV